MWLEVGLLDTPDIETAQRDFNVGHAAVLMYKAASDAESTYALHGRLFLSKSGWLLLSVPNALLRGAFDALHEPGVSLPFHSDGSLDAHISVMRPEDIEQIGGADKVTERGKMFSYQLGPVKTVKPAGWVENERVWFIEVQSPELKQLRKSYGLTPLPNNDKFQFHITFAVRKAGVLRNNEISKVQQDDEDDKPDVGHLYPKAAAELAVDMSHSGAGATGAPAEQVVANEQLNATPQPHVALPKLQAAKGYSDIGQFDRKLTVMRQLIQQHPEDFVVDSDPDGKYPGFTHVPTGFKMHLPREVLRYLATPPQQKLAGKQVSPEEANYRPAGPEEQYARTVCSNCKHFKAEAMKCDVVMGPIGPQASGGLPMTSDLYEPFPVDRGAGGLTPVRILSGTTQPGIDTSAGSADNMPTPAEGPATTPATPQPPVKTAELLPNVELQPHQKRIEDLAKEDTQRLLLYHQLGSGKSLSAIAGAEAAGEPYSVVAPASLRPNFNKELNKFTDNKTPSVVSSYSSLALGKRPYAPTVVFDEAHRMRNEASATTQGAKELARRARNLYLLSGSPIVNRPGDLAPLLSMLHNKELSPEEFEQHFVKERDVKPGIIGWLMGMKPGVVEEPQNEGEFRKLLKGHVDFHAADKPPVDLDEETHRVEMGPEQSSLYHGFWKSIPFWTRWKLRHDFPLAKDELKRMTAFLSGPRQAALSTRPFLREPDNMKAFQQSTKLRKAMSLLKKDFKQNPESKAVIFSNFIEAGLEPYSAALAAQNIPNAIFHGGLQDRDRKRIVEDYNSGKLRALLLGPSGSEGLSLRGTRLMQLLDPHWQETRLQQAIGRGVRYDSHGHLPEGDRRVRVQRLMSVLPRTFLQRLTGDEPKDVDDYLQNMARRKQELNDKFLRILQDVGTHQKQASVENIYSDLWLIQEFEYESMGKQAELDSACPEWDKEADVISDGASVIKNMLRVQRTERRTNGGRFAAGQQRLKLSPPAAVV